MNKELLYYFEKVEILPEINPLTSENDYRILIILRSMYRFKLNGERAIIVYGFDDLNKILERGFVLCTM